MQRRSFSVKYNHQAANIKYMTPGSCQQLLRLVRKTNVYLWAPRDVKLLSYLCSVEQLQFFPAEMIIDIDWMKADSVM